MKKDKIMITGGHATPAFAVIDYMLAHGFTKTQLVFVGRKHAVDYDKNLSFEFKEIKKRGIMFVPFKTGKLSRTLSLSTITNLLNIPLGFIVAFIIIKRNKPTKLLSFGGYIALPIAIWAFIFRIPIFTHEQTIQPGLANSIIALFAKKIFVSFQDSKKYFSKKKVLFTGNPIRVSVLDAKPFSISLDPHKPTIYITGGNLGSHSINTKIKQILPDLLDKYNIIHQCGNVKEFNDKKELEMFASTLSAEQQKRYILREHFFDEEIGSVYHTSNMVVSRSGANTFFELVALHKPAILIPLPWSVRDEQEKHAKLFKKMGFGEIFYQQKTASELFEIIRKVMVNLEYYEQNFKKLTSKDEINSAQLIVDTLLSES